jgi:hypothetical protein
MKRFPTPVVLGFYLLMTAFAVAQTASSPAPAASNQTVSSPASSASTQSSSPSSGTSSSSLGDYARKIRKDNGTKEKAKVFDNDNLPTQDKLSVVGQKQDSAAAAENTSDNKNDATKTGDDANKAQWKEWQGKLSAEKDEIGLASRELDVLQREYELRAAAMYGDAGNRLRNEGQWDKQDADYKQKIADKQKAIEDAKSKLSDMQEDARKAGVPNSMIDQ